MQYISYIYRQHKNILLFLVFAFFFSGEKLLAIDSNKLIITEFMIYNDTTLVDEDGDYSDWIEIFNPGTEAVNLLNWSLTDQGNLSKKWYFPDTVLQPNKFILVFASGKNRKVRGKPLHTSFKLSATDGFLALIESNGISVANSYSTIPAQFPDISYGVLDATVSWFNIPTPGAANVIGNFVPPATFSIQRGFYTQSFEVTLRSSIAGATIRYTKNGSYPSESEGILYTSPISITTTTPLQTVVYFNGKKSTAATQTYLFLDDIKKQSNTPQGYPTMWGPYTAIGGNAFGDYEMDPEVVNNSLYSGSLENAFKSIPTMSVVTSVSNLFSSDIDPLTGGIYYYTGPPVTERDVPAPVGTTKETEYGTGYGWGRPASVEYFGDANSNTFSANCRLELHGGHSRRPEKNPKHSFNIEFKRDYGVAKLKNNFFPDSSAANEFDAFVLRAGFNNTWLHGDYNQRKRGMYIHDSWMKDTQLEMGEKSAHNKFVHLYLNGLYWGLYNVSERLDKDFAESYFDGKEDDFDIIKDYGEATSGNPDAWNTMMVMANNGLVNNTEYFKLQGKNADGTSNPAFPAYVSIDNFIDYMLLNFYGGNQDWDHHNWTAIRNRNNPGKGFRFLIWDGERTLEGVNDNVVLKNNLNRPSGLFTKLKENKEFRLEFADHVQQHLFNNGLLTPARISERWTKRTTETKLAILCESARWGDYRRDVHPFGGSNYELCTKAYWDNEQTRLLNSYFPQRTAVLVNQLKNAGLLPAVEPPVFSWYGGLFKKDTSVAMSSPVGIIYYTLNGDDPRKIGGELSSSAKQYPGVALHLNDTITIKARVKYGNEWSALVKADYFMVLTNLPTTIPQTQKQQPEVLVYPNPVEDRANFVFYINEPENVTILLYRSDGTLVSTGISGYSTQGENILSINTSGLAPGIYFYTIRFKNGMVNGKLIKSQN